MHRRQFLVASAALIAPLTLETRQAAAFVDRDCADFRTQRAAQRFFVRQRRRTGVRDRHGLDGDNDGRACESLP